MHSYHRQEDGGVKKGHLKKRHQAQSQDTRGRMSTASQHQVWRYSNSEARIHQYQSPGGTENKVRPSTLQSRKHDGVTPPEIGVSQHRVWQSGSKDRTHSPGPRACQHKLGQSGSEESKHQQGAAPTSTAQSQDTRGRMSTTSQHRVWRRSNSEARIHQYPSPGGTENKVRPSTLQSRKHGVTPPEIGVSQHRVWQSSSKDTTHSPGPRSSLHKLGQSGSEEGTYQQGAAPTSQALQRKLRQSNSLDRTHKRGTTPTSGVSQHRLRRSCSHNRISQQGLKVSDPQGGRVTVAVVMKQLAELYGGHLDASKAAELVQVCTPNFLQQLEAFIRSTGPDVTFFSDLATFCRSAFMSLPSSVCVHFQHTLMTSLWVVEKLSHPALEDQFTRLQEKLMEHVHQSRELDTIVAQQNFRSVPVLPKKADAFLSPLNGKNVSVSSAEEQYLSELFFSLYEAFMGRIRDGIRSFRDTKHTPLQPAGDIQFCQGVRFINPLLMADCLCLAISLTAVCHLRVGTIVCFSCDGFQSLLFATVKYTDGQILVQLCGKGHQVNRQLFENEYVMANSGLCAEPSVSVLLTLQQLQAVPMRYYLVEGGTMLGWRHHVQEQPDLDSMQHEAFIHAVTQELCLVLGPPGSGKTHVACAVARNTSFPVFVMCKSHSGLNTFLQRLAPLPVMWLSDKTKHQQNKERRKMQIRKYAILVHLRKLELDLALLARKDGVVALESFRESGVVCDAQFRSFLQQPDTTSVYYSWLIDEASQHDVRSNPHSLVSFCGAAPHTEDTVLSAVQPSLKWAERLENVEKKRSEVNACINKLQERWGYGEDVTKEVHMQKELYRYQAFKLKRLKTRLTETWPSDRLKTCHDVWKLRPIERWGLYFAWVGALHAQLLGRLENLQHELTREDRKLELVDQLIDLKAAQQVSVVGATAGEAVRYRSVLEKLAPTTVIVDEATHITEAQLVTCLPQSCQHLVLLGELTPVQDAASCQEGHLAHVHNLVHRLIEKGMAISELKIQHRMQHQVAKLVSTLYPGLERHSSVTSMCTVKGVNQNMFFITHENMANKVGNVGDYQNLMEADFLLALCHYLVLQGYSSQDIVILTTYPSQRHYLQKECESSLLLSHVRVCLVEQFCGQECRIVLVSTVHPDSVCCTENISIMLTRAQEGLYITGNLQMLANRSNIWHVIQNTLKKDDAVGTQLVLRCQIHSDELTAVSSAADFLQIPEGGCLLPCHFVLKCGHMCDKQCHITDREHASYQCKQHE